MKTSSASNFLEENSGSSLGSTADTNSIYSDADLGAVCAVDDKNQMIQDLKNTIKRNLSQISDLERNLKVTEILLACQMDKVNDKDDVIRVLQDSIELLKKTNEVVIQQMQKSEAGVVPCNNDNYLRSRKDSLESITFRDQENDVKRSGAELLELECQANISAVFQTEDQLKKIESIELTNSELKLELDQLKSKITESQKIEDGLRKKVSELENNLFSVSAKLKESCEKLAEYTLHTDSYPDKEEIVPLNNTENRKIKVVQRDGLKPFMAVFEDIPSAGSGWMVIQSRIDGQTKFSTNEEVSLGNGFGDMNTSFWLGAEIVHQLTTSQQHELYIEVVDLDGVTAYARYDHFEVGSEDEIYKIKSLGLYSGNAGDAFRSFQNAPLEKWSFRDESFYLWWKSTQNDCNLNGYNMKGHHKLFWGRWSLGQKECILKSCKMLIRPKPE